MSWVSEQMRHTAEEVTCPIVNEQGNYHFRLICEDCDVKYRLANATLGEAQDLYNRGCITQEEYEGYRLAWDLLYPGNDPAYVDISEFPDVRRIARKLIRTKGIVIPARLVEVAR